MRGEAISAMPKPCPLRIVKQRARRQRQYTRKQCREMVYAREQWRCQRCDRPVTLQCWPGAPQFAHVNEIVPRSQGGSPTDMSNLELCCGACHMPNGQHAPTKERMLKLRELGSRYRRTR